MARMREGWCLSALWGTSFPRGLQNKPKSSRKGGYQVGRRFPLRVRLPDLIFLAPIDKRSSQRPFTAQSRVRIPLGVPFMGHQFSWENACLARRMSWVQAPYVSTKYCRVAQWLKRPAHTRKIMGSSPIFATIDDWIGNQPSFGDLIKRLNEKQKHVILGFVSRTD